MSGTTIDRAPSALEPLGTALDRAPALAAEATRRLVESAAIPPPEVVPADAPARSAPASPARLPGPSDRVPIWALVLTDAEWHAPRIDG